MIAEYVISSQSSCIRYCLWANVVHEKVAGLPAFGHSAERTTIMHPR